MKSPINGKGPALFCLLTLGLGIPLPGQTVVPPSQEPFATTERPGSQTRAGLDYAADEVLVTFKPGTSASARSNVARSLGDRLGKGLENRPDMATVKVKSGASVRQAVEAYEADPRVAHAQPNFIYHVQKTPADPQFDKQWGLENAGQKVDGDPGTAGKDIGAPRAWDRRTDCSGIPVAVIDTGINYEHTDLTGNMWTGDSNHGRDFVGSDNDPDPIPDGGSSHGTHVAGSIAAVGNNETGSTGVCWQAEIMAVRVLGLNGGYTSDVVEGVQYAVDEGAKVINLSLGGGSYDTAFRDALANARDNGVLVVAAAGNDGSDNDTDPSYPCSYDLDNIVCVAALDQDYQLAEFSNYGSTTVDVGAPGVNILSAWPGSATAYPDLNQWQVSTADTDDWAPDTSSSSPWSGDALGYPNGFYGTPGYANNQDDWIWRQFDLGGADLLGASLKFYPDIDTEPENDFVRVQINPNGEDPKDQDGTVKRGEISGAVTYSSYKLSAPLDGCLTSTCSVAFQFDSDSSNTYPGAAVGGIEIFEVTSGATATNIIDGTSMAAPHVAGIAALSWAHKPGSSYAEVRDAILQGGDTVSALQGDTTTGRETDALGTLAELALFVGDADMTTTMGTRESVTLTASALEGSSLSWSIKTPPANGTVSVNASGESAEVTYTPQADFLGQDSFIVEVADGLGATDTATVSALVQTSGDGGGGGGGCALSPTPGKLDPSWLLLLAVPWFLRRYAARRT